MTKGKVCLDKRSCKCEGLREPKVVAEGINEQYERCTEVLSPIKVGGENSTYTYKCEDCECP
jgi:hypothetical protein